MDEIVSVPKPQNEEVKIYCQDGVVLGGNLWHAMGVVAGSIIINPATGVLARYYHRYAQFLARNGFNVLTYDYRGIGSSRPASLKGCKYRWREWGEQDFEAALLFIQKSAPHTPVSVVGHSIGGFLPGLAASAPRISRMLTMGAQYAWWNDYMSSKRLDLFLKWHLAMPVLTAIYGYFPGRKLNWLEDLPKGVANEWSFRGPNFESSHPRAERPMVLARMAAVRAEILAVTMADDELGTLPAIRRTLRYYANAPKTIAQLAPSDYGRSQIGHFSLFHDRHASDFWADTLVWLKEGRCPWPDSSSGF